MMVRSSRPSTATSLVCRAGRTNARIVSMHIDRHLHLHLCFRLRLQRWRWHLHHVQLALPLVRQQPEGKEQWDAGEDVEAEGWYTVGMMRHGAWRRGRDERVGLLL